MFTGMTHASVLVSDYDEAIKWYTKVFGLELRNDASFGDDGFRWVTVGVKGQDVEIVLHKSQDVNGIGTTEAPALVFGTDDCRRDIEQLRANGVKIGLEPEAVMWGTQAVVEDLYGNKHVLVQQPSE